MKPKFPGLKTFGELFDVAPRAVLPVLVFCVALVAFAIVYFVHSAPPRHLTISTGPEGSGSQKIAEKYAKILARNGVKLTTLESNGSQENLERLLNKKVDIAFVQAGITKEANDSIASLGNISYQPVMIFYRGRTIALLSELAGKRIAIGPDGSGVRTVSLALLGENGIKEGKNLVDLESSTAARELLAGTIDAAFVMSESTPMPVLRELLLSKQIKLFSFRQAPAYARRVDFLNVLDLPEGTIDLGLDIPSHDVTLLGPMVELLAIKNLHPALSDLLIEAMTETHGKPGIYQKRGEFPNSQEHAIRISEDALRYYRSGKSILYRYFPYWFADLISRLLVAFVPTLLLIVPFVKGFLSFLKWRVNMRLRKYYKELIQLEHRFLKEKDPAKRAQIRREFDQIEEKIGVGKIRPAYADQFYGLRGHISYVRELVKKGTA